MLRSGCLRKTWKAPKGGWEAMLRPSVPFRLYLRPLLLGRDSGELEACQIGYDERPTRMEGRRMPMDARRTRMDGRRTEFDGRRSDWDGRRRGLCGRRTPLDGGRKEFWRAKWLGNGGKVEKWGGNNIHALAPPSFCRHLFAISCRDIWVLTRRASNLDGWVWAWARRW